MSSHVDTTRHTMFLESTQEVKNRLTKMCREIEESMSNKADEVFLSMRSDYMTVITGVKPDQDSKMPVWQRNLMADVTHTILALESEEEDPKDEATTPVNDTEMNDDNESFHSANCTPDRATGEEGYVKPEKLH